MVGALGALATVQLITSPRFAEKLSPNLATDATLVPPAPVLVQLTLGAYCDTLELPLAMTSLTL